MIKDLAREEGRHWGVGPRGEAPEGAKFVLIKECNLTKGKLNPEIPVRVSATCMRLVTLYPNSPSVHENNMISEASIRAYVQNKTKTYISGVRSL